MRACIDANDYELILLFLNEKCRGCAMDGRPGWTQGGVSTWAPQETEEEREKYCDELNMHENNEDYQYDPNCIYCFICSNNHYFFCCFIAAFRFNKNFLPFCTNYISGRFNCSWALGPPCTHSNLVLDII